MQLTAYDHEYCSLSEVFICITWSAQNDTQRTYDQNEVYQILRNYQTFKDRLERLQSLINNAVKPEGLELIKSTP